MAESKVARFGQQQTLQEQVARQGLYSLAIGGSHESISVHRQQSAERMFWFIEADKRQEAQALIATDVWGMEVKEYPNG